MQNKISNRRFLSFEIFSKTKEVKVSTDDNGNFEFLAIISIDDYNNVINNHDSIINSQKTNDEKINELVSLWIQVDEVISGYLFGDLTENNLDDNDLEN